MEMMTNDNMDTVVSMEHPAKWLQGQPKGKEAIHNVYELTAQPEIIQYHVVVGFPTKTTWLTAIRKGNDATWSGLTMDTVQKYFQETGETLKGHSRKMKLGI